MTLNRDREASADITQYTDDRSSDGGVPAEAQLMLATLSAILSDLAESYHAIVHGAWGGCLGGLLRCGELELVVQDALAAYQRQVLRREPCRGGEGEGYDNGVDVSDWVGLLTRRVQGRVRRYKVLPADANAPDGRVLTNDGCHGKYAKYI